MPATMAPVPFVGRRQEELARRRASLDAER